MTSIAIILLMILKFLWWVVIIQAVMSWLINFDVINLRQRFVYTVWSTLNRLTEPLYRPIRSILPPMGGLDLAPLVLIFGILALQVLISNNLMGPAYY
ncbi:YggT family protein [Albimonas sp. CAU 1670]|uniref:YggT family protein n=1 Tax=Albimonas sp. CAU 1670 TaxID=3032599 RepID=UPI0023DAEAE5|nr:YggT family protein [Albimonas sp. CAU 1670]MDF2232878.1 YggT family protein [Albimonas sp. CAU 1670]